MSPRRRDGELGPALNTERLLDDLLRAAEAGNLPLATDDECRAWVNAWDRAWRAKRRARGLSDYRTDAHGRCWVYAPEPPLEDMPLGIARRYVTEYIEVILPIFLRGLHPSTAELLAAQAWEREHPYPSRAHREPTEEQSAWWRARGAYLAGHTEAFAEIERQNQVAWAAQREYLIRRYKLGDLVRVAPGPTPDDPIAPSPRGEAG